MKRTGTALRRGVQMKRKEPMKRSYTPPTFEQNLARAEKKTHVARWPETDKKWQEKHFETRTVANASRMKRTEFKDTKANARRANEAVQRALVRERSGGRCEFERFVNLYGDDIEFAWTRCARVGGETAHIFRRRLCGSEKYHEFVAIDGCQECHMMFDSRLAKSHVRVPIPYFRRAYKHIRRMTNSAPMTKDLATAA